MSNSLSFASTAELLAEVKRRYTCCVIAGIMPAKTGQNDVFLFTFAPDLVSALGITRQLQLTLDQAAVAYSDVRTGTPDGDPLQDAP